MHRYIWVPAWWVIKHKFLKGDGIPWMKILLYYENSGRRATMDDIEKP